MPSWIVNFSKLRLPHIVSFSLLLTMFSLNADADVFNWVGLSGAAWATNTNWDPNTGFPQFSTDTANFESTDHFPAVITTVVNLGTLNSEATPLSTTILQVNAGGGLTLDGFANLGNNTAIQSNALLTFENFAEFVGAGSINSSAALRFLDNSQFSGPGTINNSLNVFFNDETQFSGQGTIVSFGSIFFFDDSQFSGPGTILNFGIMTFGQDSQFSGTGTILNNAPNGLIVFSGNSGFSGAGTIVNNASINFFGNASAGVDAIIHNNGLLSLSNLLTPGITIGEVDGPGNINLGSKVLTLSSQDDDNISGVISGTGGLVKNGTRTLTLDGINTYTGNTEVNNGTLLLGGDLLHQTATVGGDVNVNSNAIFGGFGTVGGNLFNNGTVSPGNLSIGTLHVAGNYSQTPAATYLVDIDATDADLLAIQGSASLAGNLELNFLSNTFSSDPYTILTANGSITGTFESVEIPQKFFTAEVNYLPHSVQLLFGFDPAAFEEAAQTPNQDSVANYLLETGGNDTIQALIGSLTTDEEFRAALDQISGATYANQILGLASVARSFEDRLTARLGIHSPCNDGFVRTECACCQTASSIWAAVFSGNTQLTSDEVSGLKTRQSGFSTGVEVPLGCQVRLGGALGVNKFRGHATNREVASDDGYLYQFGLYGRYEAGPWLLGVAADLGFTNDVDANRTITVTDEPATTYARYRAHLSSEQIRLGYVLCPSRFISVQPFVDVIHQNVNLNDFTEQGSHGFNLFVHPDTYASTRSQLGALIEGRNTRGIRPFLSLAWEHEYDDRKGEFDAGLVGVEGSFHIQGAEVGRDLAVINAGIEVAKSNCANLAFVYEGRFAEGWKTNNLLLEAHVRLN